MSGKPIFITLRGRLMLWLGSLVVCAMLFLLLSSIMERGKDNWFPTINEFVLFTLAIISGFVGVVALICEAFWCLFKFLSRLRTH